MGDRLPARFQIQPNVFAQCYLDWVSHSGNMVKVSFGVKKYQTALIAPGTQIFLDTAHLPSAVTLAANQGFSTVVLTVQNIESTQDEVVLLCQGPEVIYHAEARTVARQQVNFPIHCQPAGRTFMVTNASTAGLGLTVTPGGGAVLGLRLDQPYSFAFEHRGTVYSIDGTVRHIQYDWRQHAHWLGIQLQALNPEQETALNLMIDPTYKVDLSFDANIDAGSGKISAQG
jgi:hypothetical protein